MLSTQFIEITCITRYTLMNLDVINGMDSGGQVGQLLARLLYKYRNFTVTSDVLPAYAQDGIVLARLLGFN